jgi:hypothetical protein
LSKVKEKAGLDMSKIKKKDLSEFIETMVTKRKETMKKEMTDKVVAELEGYTQDFLMKWKAEDIQKHAGILVDRLEPVRGAFHASGNYNRIQAITADLNSYVVRFERTFRSEIREAVERFVRNPSDNHKWRFDHLGEGVWKMVEPLTPKIMQCNKDRTALTNIKHQLLHAIRNASTGKKAYEALVALEVDMSEFEIPVNKNLPAVIKLEHPVCLLNGGC